MKRRIPTRVVETGRVVRGSSGQGVGWLQDLAERFRALRAAVSGVHARLNTPLRDGVPSAVSGELTFRADTSRVITITFPKDPDASPPVAFTTLKVNPIFLAGETYRIPVFFPPPGVLEAHNLVVGIEAGFTMFANVNRSGITPLNDYRYVTQAPEGGFVPKPSVGVLQYTFQQQVLGDFAKVMPFIPYMWNIVDEKSGRQYAQDWMPHGALLNTRKNGAGNTGVDAAEHVFVPDSELFEFDAPWIFERDGQVSFLFRPIMDLYQIDASDAQLPYGGVDDKSGGRRFEQATVRVEFHGNRYYTGQDVLKDGAFLTDGPEPARQSQGHGDPHLPGGQDNKYGLLNGASRKTWF